MRTAAHTLSDGAFSLVELLIVLALLLILTVLSASRLTTSARRRELAARKIAAMSLREQWDLACAIGAAQFRLRQRATVEA